MTERDLEGRLRDWYRLDAARTAPASLRLRVTALPDSKLLPLDGSAARRRGALLLAGCSATVTQLKAADPISESECDVTLHSSEASAKTRGPIEELCVIEGDSKGSFIHTLEVAVNKHKHRACECGATDVYIQSHEGGKKLSLASVTMVAFRYTGR